MALDSDHVQARHASRPRRHLLMQPGMLQCSDLPLSGRKRRPGPADERALLGDSAVLDPGAQGHVKGDSLSLFLAANPVGEPHRLGAPHVGRLAHL